MSFKASTHLSELSAFAELPKPLIAELHSISRLRSYSVGATIVRDGEISPFIGFVSRGILRMQKTHPDGRQKIVGLLVESDMFGRVFDGPQHLAIEAATNSVVLTFNRQAFERLISQWRELEKLVLLNILNELDAAREWMMVLGSRTVKARLAEFLLVLCRRWSKVDHLIRLENGVIEVEVPISRSDLAHLLAARPESISRAFHALSDDGIIVRKTPSCFEIRSLEALIELSGYEITEVADGLDALQRMAG